MILRISRADEKMVFWIHKSDAKIRYAEFKFFLTTATLPELNNAFAVALTLPGA
jgi:hypothetical protein